MIQDPFNYKWTMPFEVALLTKDGRQVVESMLQDSGAISVYLKGLAYIQLNRMITHIQVDKGVILSLAEAKVLYDAMKESKK